MNELQNHSIDCPYCGENIEIDFDQQVQVSATHENE